ncbi:Integrator complex subunit 12 [Temnothorax longispinosus]|uniref:Integrator complex subunit 12 n=1 Tax=Temnothorax longispinosus TaxID=300112 RepID=A0A4S2KM76_9HYME|nr:Integrator complex subunit 12 [Temnothorax longispinosus]
MSMCKCRQDSIRMSERRSTFDNQTKSEDTSLEGMYKSTSDIDEDLLDALALLHSTERDSEEKLRRMLDTCIERKHGIEKTLAARMPKRFLQNVNESALPMQFSKRHDHVAQGRSVVKTEIWNGNPEIISLLEVDEPESIENHRTSDVKVFEVDYYEDCCEDGKDIPRISIPDEGFADGTVCKCQKHQEAYHLLCHQPLISNVGAFTTCVETL